MKYRREIELYANEENKPVLLWLFDRYHWSTEWSFVAKCTFLDRPYPNNHRVWEPTEEGRILYNHGKHIPIK